MKEFLSPPFPFRASAATGLRVGIALVLLVAAGMKCYQLSTSWDLGEGLLHARWFNQLVVLWEIAFGIWLLSGLLAKPAWLLSVLCFSAFAIVSGYKYWIGEGSCGCFGNAAIPPFWTALFDLTVVGLLIVFRPAGLSFCWKEASRELLCSKKKILWAGCVWLLLAAPLVFAMTSVQKNDIAELGTEFIGADGRKTIVLEPDQWVGKPLPLLQYIEPKEVRENLKTGIWTVVLYHHDCSKCREMISQYDSAGQSNVIAIEVPPYGVYRNNNIRYGRLNDHQDWFVPTPSVFELNQIVVLSRN